MSERARARWRLELSRDAARTVQDAPPVVRRALARILDRLERRGPGAEAEPLGDGRFHVLDGEWAALVRVDTDARSILVARLDRRTHSPTRTALRTARVPAERSSVLARQLDELTGDLRRALRGFGRSRGFVFSVVATLAVAIGGTTALYGLGSAVFRGALPFEDGDELLRLRDRRVTAGGGTRIFNMSPLNFAAIRDRATTLDGVAAMGGVSRVLAGDGPAQRINVIRVSDAWADLLGLEPTLGRSFSADEAAAGPDAGVVLLSHALWEARFGGDPSIVGRTVSHDAGVWTVVGVMPPRIRYPYTADAWIPWRWDETDGAGHDLNVVGRMSEETTLADVHADLDRIAAELQGERADTNTDLWLNAESLRSDFIRDDDRVLIALGAAVAFLLLLACVNVTNLFVARFVSREREVGIRVALGAGRVRQVRAFMLESVLLFTAGGLLGLVLSVFLSDALSILMPSVMRTQLDMWSTGVGSDTLAFALVVSIGTGVLFGLVAALRGTGADVGGLLRDGARAGESRGVGTQGLLVVTQLALSLALLVGAGVLFEHFRALSADDLGMRIDGLYTVRVSLDQERLQEPDVRLATTRSLTEALARIPGVESVGYTTVNPICCGDWGASIQVENGALPWDATHLIHHRLVGPGYFEATGTALLEGRDFDERDAPGSLKTVIVDEAAARRFWPGESALGRRIRLNTPNAEWRTVVGVVGDVREAGDYSETWYWPYRQEPTTRSSQNLHFMLRSGDPGVLEDARRAVAVVDPNLAVYAQRAMASLKTENLAQDRLGAWVGGVFGAFGLLLAGLGVYGMLSYNVSTRAREIGTRIALGARTRQVTGLVLRRAMRLTAIGGIAGLALAWVLNAILQRVVFGVETAGPGLVVGVALILVAASAAAAAVPALRASRVDPVHALKE